MQPSQPSKRLAATVKPGKQIDAPSIKVRSIDADNVVQTHRLESAHDAFGLQPGSKAAWITPHDDDPLIGAGGTILLLSEAEIESHILITTDGSMGYHDAEHRKRVVEERKQQTIEAYKMVGVSEKNIHFMDFPDAGLTVHSGRNGDSGLQVAYEKILRRISPSAVFFVGVRRDSIEHPDHIVVSEQGLWAARHASGTDWQDIAPGGNFRQSLRVFEYPVYSELAGDPSIQIVSEHAVDRKVEALAKYVGQSIQDLVDQQKERGGEYFREIPIAPNFSRRYAMLFS
jgi:LmbE family N-acetylglucosaminyl deacetylase